MDWQLIGVIGIGAAALVGFFAVGRPKAPEVQTERRVQGLDVLRPAPKPQVETEVIRNFIKALRDQS